MFGPNLVFGPDLSLVRICRCSKSGFLSGFVFGPTLVFGPKLSLVSNQKMRWNLSFGPKLVFRSILVFAPKLYLIGIWFSVRICHRSKSGFMSKSVFGPKLILVRNCLWSEFVFGSELCSVRVWFSVRIFPRCDFVSGPILLLVRTWLWSLSGFRSEYVFYPNLSFVRFCR